MLKMDTAIIGTGNIGSRLAKNLTAAGEKIIIGNRVLSTAQKLVDELGPNATAMTISDAVGAADVVIMAVYFDVIEEMFATYRRALEGKIVVDPSNPIAPDGNGGFKKTIPADQSSGQLLVKLLPEGTELVKAFGTLGAESLSTGAHRLPENAVLFYATDYPEAARVVAKLITACGFSPFNVGGIDQSIRIEVGGDLHEFGKLGKLVSAKEAEALL
jgi:8-hydroxy-5-deazaflavin:NADPH oxidoreductase